MFTFRGYYTNRSFKRLKTLTEFRTMAVAPFPIQCVRGGKWVTIQTDELLPGDVVSVGKIVLPYRSRQPY